jgi:hypothetical protein
VTRADVELVLNRAADDVLDAVRAPDEGVRDVVNLVVNVALTRLDVPDAELELVAQRCYSEPLATVLDWCER